jgi:hypothetical protein
LQEAEEQHENILKTHQIPLPGMSDDLCNHAIEVIRNINIKAVANKIQI